MVANTAIIDENQFYDLDQFEGENNDDQSEAETIETSTTVRNIALQMEHLTRTVIEQLFKLLLRTVIERAVRAVRSRFSFKLIFALMSLFFLTWASGGTQKDVDPSLIEIQKLKQRMGEYEATIDASNDKPKKNANYERPNIRVEKESQERIVKDEKKSKRHTGSDSMKAVPIVELNDKDHTFVLHKEELERILLHPKIADKKVMIQTIAGPFRKGKSFMQNIFLRHLQHHQNDRARAESDWFSANGSGEERRASTLGNGFEYRGGSKLMTKGILIWPEPLVRKQENGEEIAVILIDTQGSFDHMSTVHDNAVTFALASMLSSSLIYNLGQNIGSDDLQNLQFFSSYGERSLEGNSTEKPFQSLLFLIRDWSWPGEKPFGFKGGQQLVDQQLQITEGQTTEMKKLRKDIQSRLFTSVKGFLVPHPGLEVTEEYEEFNGEFSKIRSQFLDQVRVLTESIFSPANLIPKRINGETVTCRQLLPYIYAYFNAFKDGKLPPARSLHTTMSEIPCEEGKKRAIAHYKDSMASACNGKMLTDGAMAYIHDKHHTEAQTMFREIKSLADSEMISKYLEEIGKEIEKLRLEFFKENNEKWRECLREKNRFNEEKQRLKLHVGGFGAFSGAILGAAVGGLPGAFWGAATNGPLGYVVSNVFVSNTHNFPC